MPALSCELAPCRDCGEGEQEASRKLRPPVSQHHAWLTAQESHTSPFQHTGKETGRANVTPATLAAPISTWLIQRNPGALVANEVEYSSMLVVFSVALTLQTYSR